MFMPIRIRVTTPSWFRKPARAERTLRRAAGAAGPRPCEACSRQRMPTGANTMQSGQTPRPHSEQDTRVSRSGCR
jgi:hypothetical protein